MIHFIHWYYTTAWRGLIKGWKNFIRFWWYYFSVPWLFRTLLAPWHRDITSYGRGFDIQRFFTVFGNNLISRFIGLGVRLGAFGFWLILELATAVGGLVLLTLWPALLLLLAAALAFGLFAFSRGPVVGLMVLVMPLLFSFIILRGFRRRKLFELADLTEVELAAQAPELWQKILGRLGYTGAPEAFYGARQNFLMSQNFTEEDFERVFYYELEQALAEERRRRFWEAEALFGVSPLGRSWAYGYTVNLDKIGVDVSRVAKPYPHRGLVERAKEVRQIETILSRARENNVLVVGEPGVGRKTVVEDFASLLNQGKLANVISHKRLIELDRQAVPDAATLDHILKEAAVAGNVILVLPMLEYYVKDTEVLVPYLRSAGIQIIGITSYAALHDVLERNPELLSHFEKVEVKETDIAETLHILLDSLASLEKRYGVFVPYPVAKDIVEKTDRYIQDTPAPKKALDLLDRALSVAAEQGEKVLTPARVDAVLSEKTEIPIAKPTGEEQELLLNLEAKMHERLINQEAAVRQIADALRRARVNIQASERPIASFLFLGPTGVGKTETAKQLARLYYGSAERLIRLDMSEFQEVAAIGRFIGHVPTNTQGVLTTAVRENPASLVLLDEIEKAHPDILNLFLQVLDDGRLTDAWGRTVKFTSAFIIATSNAGSEMIREAVKTGADPATLQAEILDALQVKGVFRPEFLNRFDGVVIFRTLAQPELEKIAFLMLEDLALRLKAQYIIFVPTAELAREVASRGWHPEFGARPMRRVIQDNVEAALAKQILAGTLQKGATIAPHSFNELTV